MGPDARFVMELMFEWGGGCLWCCNDAARATFGVGPAENRLPLTSATRQQLAELSAWHDDALDWEYPPKPSPWPPGERERFERAAVEVLALVRSELGTEFEVAYVPL